jgi:hypothetical protein
MDPFTSTKAVTPVHARMYVDREFARKIRVPKAPNLESLPRIITAQERESWGRLCLLHPSKNHFLTPREKTPSRSVE